MGVKALALALAAALSSGAAPAGIPAITDLRPVALHPGINCVPGFLADGRTATIVEAWRGNGNAHGHHVWIVLGGASEGHPVGLVGDPIGDDPFDGERVLGAVRFARARLAGKPVSLLIRADLDPAPGGVPADHAPATVRWFRLDHEDDAIGRPTDAFVPLARVRTTRRYCNAELALRDAAGIALPPDFAGPNRIDGCFPGG